MKWSRIYSYIYKATGKRVKHRTLDKEGTISIQYYGGWVASGNYRKNSGDENIRNRGKW